MRTASRITMGSPFFSVFLASGPPAGSLRYIALIYAAPFRACASPRPLYYRPVSPRLLLFGSAVTRFSRHASEIGIQAGAETEAAASNRADECTRAVQRQRCNVAAEIFPDAVLLQVLLDIRKIERCNGLFLLPDILANRPDRFRSCEIPNDRYQQVLRFERFHDREILFAGEITSEDALSVRGRHQVGIGYAAKATSAARTVVDAGSEPIEVVIDVLDSAEIVFRERKAVLFGQMLLDGFEIFRIEHI